MNEVTKLAIKFISENWDKIDRKRIGSIHSSKEGFIKDIEDNYNTACWVVTEVMSWGADKDYIKEYQVENEEELFVVELNSKYFKINFETHCLDECKPRYKTVAYF